MAQRFESKGYLRPSTDLDRTLTLRKYAIYVTFLCSRTLENPQDFYEKAITWKRLKHPNIVPLLGINVTPSPPQLISDWILGGNLTEYIKNNPGADRLGLVGDPLPPYG